MGALISYNNLADSATITNSSDGSETTTIDNIQERSASKLFEQALSLTSPLESVKIDLDFTTAKSIKYVGIFGHNITAGTYVVDLGTTLGASDVATTNGTLWQGVTDDVKQQHIIFSAVQSARYCRITLTPTSGDDVQVGRVWVDSPWIPDVDLSFDITVIDPSESVRSVGGSRYAYERPRYRQSRITFNKMTEQQALGSSSDNTIRSAHHMDTTVGTAKPLVIIPETGGADAEQVKHKLGFYGSISNSTAIEVMPAPDGSGGWRYRKSFTFEEER